MSQIRKAALIGVSLLGLSAPTMAQTGASPPADVVDGNPPADPSGGNQDVIPGGEPEAALEANDANTIVVEARRRDESVQDVPLVVNAVTAEKIAELNLRDFKEIQTVVPGLTMTSNTNGIGTTSSIRGVNFDVNASGAFGTIEYYLNDAPITSGAIFNAMYDIGQIEVLRGPQGTLRGKASPSGSITVSHRKPDLDELGGYVLSTVNDIGGTNVNVALGVPIIPGMLAIRVAGLVERGEGSRVHSINNQADPYTRTESGRVFLRFEPTSWLNAEAVYQRIEQKARQFNQVACFNQFSTTTTAPCPVTIDPEDRLGIQFAPQQSDQTFDIFTWRASAAFMGQRLFYVGLRTDQFINAFAPGDLAAVVNGVFCETCTTNDSTNKTHEVRLQNEERLFGMLDYVVGYFNFKANTPSYLVTGRVAAGSPANPIFAFSPTLRTNETKEESYFGNLTLHLGESTEFSGGARHIKINTDSRLFSVVLPTGVTAPRLLDASNLKPLITSGTPVELLFGAPNPREFSKTIFSASAKHRFDDDLMVYANFGTSFRPGNNIVRFPPNARTSPTEVGFLVTPAETSESFEIGLKSDWFDDTVRLNVAAYRQDFENYPFRASSGTPTVQYATLTSNPTVASVNFVAPVPVRVEGFEAELDWRPSAQLAVTGNLSYARGRIKNGQVPCLDLNRDGVPDTTIPNPLPVATLQAATGPANVSVCTVDFRSANASPWGANLQAEYNMPVFSDRAEAFFRGLLAYNGSRRNDEQNPFDNTSPYTLVNLYAGLRDPDGAWDVSLFGKNIFSDDTVLATSLGALSTNAPTSIGSQYIGLGNPSFPGLVAPREFGITARFAFGSR